MAAGRPDALVCVRVHVSSRVFLVTPAFFPLRRSADNTWVGHMRNIYRFVIGSAAVTLGACSFLPTDTTSLRTTSIASAFNSIPLGFSNTQSTFDTGADSAWRPGPHRGPGPEGPGFGMMGGLGPEFFGGIGFGPGGRGGPFGGAALSGNCAYSASTGRVTCDPVTVGGLTILRSAAYLDAAGKPQSAFDSVTTNSVNSRIQVAGTVTRRDSAVSTVSHASDRTVSGLAAGSTQRSVNGTSSGTENTTGTNSTGHFTAARVAGDTVTGVIVPVSTSGSTAPAYPTAGTVIRHMQASVTYDGQTPQASDRREVITYDGSSTAKLVITQDGVTTTCTIALPRGRPVCG